VAAYDPSAWSELFVATAGACAALAGLVFVAVSINVERILAFEGLPERGLETVLLLLGAVVMSIAGLIPGQSTTALGVEMLSLSVLNAGVISRLSMRSLPPGVEPRRWIASRVMLRAIGTVPFIIGAVTLLAEAGGGLYWTAAGIVGATVGAVLNAWVLLVEILR
jgi:hypothetical protein